MTIQYKRKTSKVLLKLLGILKCNIKTLKIGKIIIVTITHITLEKNFMHENCTIFFFSTHRSIPTTKIVPTNNTRNAEYGGYPYFNKQYTTGSSIKTLLPAYILRRFTSPVACTPIFIELVILITK